MQNLIDLFKRFIEENRKNNIATNCNWHNQYQEIYVHFNNAYATFNKPEKPSTSGKQKQQ
jgi:hypothetical protein